MENKMNYNKDLEIFENLDELVKFVQTINRRFD